MDYLRVPASASNAKTSRADSAFGVLPLCDKSELTSLQPPTASRPTHRYARMQRPLFGYLLTCRRTVAWRGSVQVPGSSLSIRLPAVVAWLSFGLRGPGAVGRERLKRGVLSSK
jgi:hypothetical protein